MYLFISLILSFLLSLFSFNTFYFSVFRILSLSHSVGLSASLSVCLSVCLFVCLTLCLSVCCLSVSLSVSLSASLSLVSHYPCLYLSICQITFKVINALRRAQTGFSGSASLQWFRSIINQSLYSIHHMVFILDGSWLKQSNWSV